jgi:hypothetical protein
MAKNIVRIAIVLTASILINSGSQNRLKAADGREMHYTVRYACIIGPGNHIGDIEGEWDVDCDGNWTGWGWMPGTDCTTTDISYGNFCY